MQNMNSNSQYRRTQERSIVKKLNDKAVSKIREARRKPHNSKRSIINHYATCTKFTSLEIQSLSSIFDAIVREYERPINILIFRDVMYNMFNICNSKMSDAIFKALNKSISTTLSMEEWIRAMHIYLRGTFEERANFAFSVYESDLRAQRRIHREKISQFISNTLILKSPQDDYDEYTRDLTSYALDLFKVDRNGSICRESFVKAVKREPLLLEIFGDCLPKQEDILSMEYIISQENPKLKKRRGRTYVANDYDTNAKTDLIARLLSQISSVSLDSLKV